jgi:hypothetical protein
MDLILKRLEYLYITGIVQNMLSKKAVVVGIISYLIFTLAFHYSAAITNLSPLTISILVALSGWFLKTYYENHNIEIKTLREIEAVLISNLARNTHNTEFFVAWRQALEEDQLYDVVFREYLLINDIKNISNNELYNKAVKLNVFFESWNLDLKNLFSSYKTGSDKMLFSDHTKEWFQLNKNVLAQTEEYLQNFYFAETEAVEALSFVRCYFTQLKYSLFRVINLMSRNIYPSIEAKSLAEEELSINTELASHKEVPDTFKKKTESV